MLRTDIDQPREPETLVVPNAAEASSRQYFQRRNPIPAQKLRAEACSGRRAEHARLGSHPAIWIPIQKRIGNNERLPRRPGKAAGTVKFASGALIKKQVGALEISAEFDYVAKAIACLGKYRLGATTQIPDKLSDESPSLTQGRHSYPKKQPNGLKD
jgi:hypothetical protein